MRRRRRQLSNFLTALSLLLCVAAIVLWVRGYRACDILHVRTGARWFYVVNYPGRVGFGGWDRAEHDPVRALPRPFTYQRRSPAWAAQEAQRTGRDARWHVGFAGLAFVRGDGGLKSTWEIMIPLWLAALCFGAAPARRAWRTLRQRPPPGHCPRCAYDLTGNVSGTCPECGTAIATPHPTGTVT